MKQFTDSPRGRFVRAYLRRNPVKSREYFNVSDYQERIDRLRTKQIKFANPQLQFPFMLSSSVERKNGSRVERTNPMKVSVEIDRTDVDGDNGPVDGLILVCQRCGHEVEVPGVSSESARYGATKLRDECPTNENNFYDVDYWQ